LYGWFYRLGGRYRHFAAYERAVFGAASHTHILMISDVQKAVFQRIYHTPDRRMTLLPPGIARDRCAPENSAALRAQLRAEFNLSDAERLVLMVGSGFRTKGVDRSIEALAALPPALRSSTRLIVIGQDKPASYLARARRLGVGDRLTILSGRDDIPRFMQGADLLLHPARHENTGTVLLEAVAAGLPVLVTDVCGYAHFITEAGAGRVLPSPFAAAALQQALAAMLSASPAQRQAWRTSALNFARTADIYSMPEHAAATIVACLEQRGERG
jgi:UDP-glucose:(heptosyl)LPS alpha-1,3-glucosyltransferase